MRGAILRSLLVGSSLALAGTVSAEEITYRFEAEQVFAQTGFDPGSDAGQAATYENVSGTFSYNTTAPFILVSPDGTLARYATGEIRLDQFDWVATYTFNTTISDDRDTGLRQFDNLTMTGIGAGGGRQDFMSLSLNDPTQSALFTTALPDYELFLSDFDIKAFQISDVLVSGSVASVRFDLTALERVPDDADEDGVLDDVDVCPDTVIPEAAPTSGKLGNGRYALTEAGVTTFSMGKATKVSFTIADTGGCSCEQIVAIEGLGGGQLKNGCSISTMLDWTEGLVTGE